jgi:hypothetical protein
MTGEHLFRGIGRFNNIFIARMAQRRLITP